MAEPTKPDPIEPDPSDPTNAANAAAGDDAPDDAAAESGAATSPDESTSSETPTAAQPAAESSADEVDADAAADAILAEAMATGKIPTPAAAKSESKPAATGEASISAAELEAAMTAFKAGASNPPPSAPVAPPAPPPKPRDVAAELGATPFEAPALDGSNDDAEAGQLDLLDDVELEVTVELGRAEMYIEDVLRLGVGSVVELDKLAGDPVEIYVNAQLVARGEVLVLNDNFCVRINDIVSPIAEPESRK